MKRLGFILSVMLLLIIGGGLTSQIAANNGENRLPAAIIQFDQPEASVFEATPAQAQGLMLLILVALGSLIGMGVVMAVLFYVLDRGVRRSRALEGGRASTPATAGAEDES